MRSRGIEKRVFRKREVVKMATLMIKKRSGVSVRYVMMVALVATCFVHQLHARNTIIEFLTAGTQVEGGKGNEKECCETCLCALSYPPQCQCLDIGETCYVGCDLCACTRSLPPQCRCLDIKPYCPHKCPTVAPYEAIVSSTHTDPTA